MDKPTEQQIKEFWEWCGFSLIAGNECDEWRFPDGQDYWNLPDIDLNNLFEYAVPIVLDKMSWTEWFHFMVSWAIKLYDKKDPAHSLFWLIGNKALWQVKDS